MAHKILEGKKGIIFGALNDQSIAWKAAEKVKEAGGDFVLSNAPIALRMGAINELAEKTGAEVIAADATDIEDLTKLVDATVEKLGKIDFVLHSIGMSPNVRKKKQYGELDYNFYQKTLDISAMSFHKVMQTLEKQDALNQGASILALSYIAAQRIFPDYGDMADAKALLESIARGYGYRLGKSKGARVNTISQSPTITTAGSGIKGFNAFYDYADKMSPLGNAPADACADYIVSLFSDYTRMVTMQNLMHDGGFSSTGITPEIVEMVEASSQG